MVQLDKTKFGPWAIVTGASAGIGEAFARQLAANGLNLVLVARRAHLLERLGSELAAAHGIEYRVAALDLMDEGFFPALEAVTKHLEIGLLISNAGTGIPGEFLSIPRADLLGIVNLNVVAHLHLTHHYGRQMAQRGRGGIVLVSAMGAPYGIPYMANDSATKSYVNSLGQALNHEFKQHGINVTVVLPGPTKTPVLDKFGFTDKDMPVKPMSAEQCVTEGLNALKANRPSYVTGALFRVMDAIMPPSVIRYMNGRMFSSILHKRAVVQ